jgi:hypothetical protein
MTKKVKLTNARRDVIREFGVKHIAESIDRTKEQKHLTVMIDGANTTIRAKYPETDMAVLRKFQLEQTDRCLKFQFPSGRVDGFNFPSDAAIADIPYCRSCRYGNNDVFAVTAAFEKAFDEHAKLKTESDKRQQEKVQEFLNFLGACQYVEEVLDVIPLPEDIRKRVGHESTGLVAVTPETVKSLKATFKQAA